MKSHHMEMDEKWAARGMRHEWEKGGNWHALPVDMNGGHKGEERGGK